MFVPYPHEITDVHLLEACVHARHWWYGVSINDTYEEASGTYQR